MHFSDAIVLSSVAIGEADSLYSLYTKDSGKIRARAQGVKKEEAKLRGHLEIPMVTHVGLVETKQGERLAYAEGRNAFSGIRSDFERMRAARYVLSVVDAALYPGVSDHAIWDLLEDTLSKINSGNAPFTHIISAFETRFLENLGYGTKEDISILGLPVPRWV